MIKILVKRRFLVYFSMCFGLSGCCISPTSAPKNIPYKDKSVPLVAVRNRALADPFAPINRGIFTLNRVADKIVIKPLQCLYGVLPLGVKSIFVAIMDTLGIPVSAVNAWIQGDPALTMRHMVRFFLNASVGLGGIVDVPKRLWGWNLPAISFAQTLQKAGYGPGCFIVLPLLGPCTLRDVMGRLMDCAFQPLTYWARAADFYYPLEYWNLKMQYAHSMEMLENRKNPYEALSNAFQEYNTSGKTPEEDWGEEE